MSTENIPFTTFRGKLRQIDSAVLPDTFDLFFPKFRTEEEWRSPSFWGEVTQVISSRTTSFIGRGRERRFAGDKSLSRGRYYCMVDSATNSPKNNTLLAELFAYADPALPVQLELLDSTVDTPQAAQIARAFDWDVISPCLIHVVKGVENPWIFSPVLGIGPNGLLIRYVVNVVDKRIDKVVDLRLPSTLDWLMQTFGRLEAETEFVTPSGEAVHTGKTSHPPSDLASFLRLVLSQSLGGGNTFIQGIGAWMRANGANALIYPSARSDSRTVVRDNAVIESFGYILLDYSDAAALDFDAKRYFGALPSWTEHDTRSFTIEETRTDSEFTLDIRGVRRLQECRFAMFHDWIVQTLTRVQADLRNGSETLSDQVKLVIRRPAEVLGEWAEEVLGPGQTFLIDEGGPRGFLARRRYLDNARFTASVLPLLFNNDWNGEWQWDERNWFLHRKCLRRPWAVLKCPVCYFEQFWNVMRGAPEGACFRCGFKKDHSEARDFEGWHSWAAALNCAPTSSGLLDPRARYQENFEIYSAVCERARDAISGHQPSTQEEAVQMTLTH